MSLFVKRVTTRLAAVAVVALICVFFRAFPPEPVNCALCGEGRFVIGNAPFLLELSSGKSCELRIYERVPYNLYDLAAEQRVKIGGIRPSARRFPATLSEKFCHLAGGACQSDANLA